VTYLVVRKLHEDALTPYRASRYAAGLDLFLYSPNAEHLQLLPHTPTRLSTGVSVEIPLGSVGHIWDRSSLGVRGIRTLAGVIDCDYRGPLQVCLINLTNEPIQLQHRDRIAQLVVIPLTAFELAVNEHATETERGEGGFGSTGR